MSLGTILSTSVDSKFFKNETWWGKVYVHTWTKGNPMCSAGCGLWWETWHTEASRTTEALFWSSGAVVFMVWYLCTYAPRVYPRIQQYQLNRYSQTGCGNHYRLLWRNSLKPTLRVSVTLWVQLELSNSPVTGAYPMLLYCFESKLNDKKPNCLWDTRDTEDKPAPATKTTFVLHSVLFW